jgi:SAM-dependent methyltransferase
VGPAGEVLGIDVAEAMLALAESRARNVSWLRFAKADAQVFKFPEAHFDIAFSRVGVMFFEDPAHAFTNIRTALRPGGRLAFVCFRKPAESPYLMVPLAAAYKHVTPLPAPAPDAPGMFSFADDQRVRRILETAGFSSVELTPLNLDVDIAAGQGLDAAVAIAMELGPTGNAMMGKPPELWQAAAAEIREALAPYQRGATVALAAGVWIVTATSP